ncbi:AMP-binding protein [Allochromatium palmeri]|uniref:AMP-binding protein n=1 Tax=Allochromatium palmeri TaxID=231048 RepID=A0A6N8EET9_9GAMM|nr:AMP-binding protein [Allochromatium palmeri]MTW22755.1 AMP-binding protein [Allochromatium palmeri]
MNDPGPVLITDGDRLGADAFAHQVAERAAAFMACGLRPGQVVMVPDSPAFDLTLTILALGRIGAGVFPYRSGLDPAERLALADLAGVEWLWNPDSASLMPASATTQVTDVPPESSAALLIKTSGSSGHPQIVMHDYAGLRASASRVNARLGVTAESTWLCCLRLSHIGGAAILYRAALAGARLRLHDGFDAPTVLRELEAYGVTHVSLVPPMLARLLDLGGRAPPSLRVVLVGGQALSRPLAKRALAAGWPIQLTYGMTETGSQIATSGALAAEDGGLDTSLVGTLLPDVDIEAPDCDAPTARLRIRGPMLMLGYANPERQPGQGLDEGGWFEPADLGCLTGEGRLRILGRADDICVIGGTNVSLTRIAHALQEASGVSEVQIVAGSDPVWGHRLVAVYAGASDDTELANWCRVHLSGPECPRAFIRLKRLPLLDSGKYDRARIAALVRDQKRFGEN